MLQKVTTFRWQLIIFGRKHLVLYGKFESGVRGPKEHLQALKAWPGKTKLCRPYRMLTAHVCLIFHPATNHKGHLKPMVVGDVSAVLWPSRLLLSGKHRVRATMRPATRTDRVLAMALEAWSKLQNSFS
jgi:hypothetical protein